jgi:hypothetical protein
MYAYSSHIRGTEPNHTSLSIIDRMIRTIRDMAYNLGADVITTNNWDHVLDEYNHTPHDRLTELAGFDVSP